MRSIPANPRNLGNYPTPVFRLCNLDGSHGTLWVKNDGCTHSLYGGNKVRKLGPLLEAARRRGSRRVLTAGGAGSHHVLATTLFAREWGLRAAAVLCPQPYTEHAEQTLRCGIANGLEPYCADSMASVPWALLDNWQSGDFVIPVGGWGVAASIGYADAVDELVAQSCQEELSESSLPIPDLIVVALGSGGTAAGLLAGITRANLPTCVLATTVAVRSPALARGLVVPLAFEVARRTGQPVKFSELNRRLIIDNTQLGAGYGAPTKATNQMISLEKVLGLQLDHTYTAKALATALQVVGHETSTNHPAAPRVKECLGNASKQRPLRVLYWHTLAATPLEPLLVKGSAGLSLPGRLRMLLQGG